MKTSLSLIPLTRTHRLFLLATFVVGCSASPGSCQGCGADPIPLPLDAGSMQGTVAMDAGAPKEFVGQKPATAPRVGAGQLCVHVPRDIIDRWPQARDDSLVGIRRWKPEYELGGPECPIHLGFNRATARAKTQFVEGRCVIGVNPREDTVDGEQCVSDWRNGVRQIRLRDIVAHEYGHCVGLPHLKGVRDQEAMGNHTACHPVFPTQAELELLE